MGEGDSTRWLVVRLAEAAEWPNGSVENLRAAYSRIRTLTRTQEYRSPEVMMLLEKIREARRQLEANATPEMLQILLAHDEERLAGLHESRSTVTGPRAAAIDRGIDRITTHANDTRERLIRR